MREHYAREINLHTGFAILESSEKTIGGICDENLVRFGLVHRNADLWVDPRFRFGGFRTDEPPLVALGVRCTELERGRERRVREKGAQLMRDFDGIEGSGGREFRGGRYHGGRMNGHRSCACVCVERGGGKDNGRQDWVVKKRVISFVVLSYCFLTRF